MAIAQDICVLALQNILNDDATSTPTTSDLNLSFTLLVNLLDHLQLDPQSAIGLQEFVYTPPIGTQSITIGASKTISSLTSVSTTATATCTSHGLNTGAEVNIVGATPAAYNGTYIITVVDANTFTYVFAGGTSPATGTILANPDVVTLMPVRLEESSFCRLGGVDFLIGFAGSFEEYNAQPVKTNQGYPTKCFYMPNNASNWATLYIWPATNGAELHLWIRQQPLFGFNSMTLASTLSLQMGMEKVLVDMLAKECLDAFNVPEPTYSKIERKGIASLRKWKRANLKLNQLQMPVSIGRYTANNYTA